MAFYIHGIIASRFEFNEQRLGLYTLGELGDDAGLKIETAVADYKKGLLRILSKLTLYIEHEEQSHWLAACSYITLFEMNEPTVFTRGASKNALGLLRVCCDLNQAHAYARFIHVLEKNDLPLVPSQLQPQEDFQQAFQGFLKKHNQLKK